MEAIRLNELLFGSVGWQFDDEFWALVRGLGASGPVRAVDG